MQKQLLSDERKVIHTVHTLYCSAKHGDTVQRSSKCYNIFYFLNKFQNQNFIIKPWCFSLKYHNKC